ncbi:GFA family protein [Thalassospira sp. MCCC 1A03138]|uniref:GFA family protein n=1 Tax=Thalassospira sp. MCCC 1A03138 TaxID=1470576 RepID=UPI000A1EE289|nr:GFA family protein [Thalassospira sp. MCCC 1A03138]OSQ28814.1 aldehyde-activating protein [Thalassospira sp. MCCC 1A03138]
MSEKSYNGGCQCGAVRYRVDKLDLDKSITCNCSRCQKLGSVLAFTPRDNFILKSGGQNLTEYLFNDKKISHQFCKTCGIQSFAYGQLPDGSKMAAINVNCLDDVDPRSLTPHHVDGKSH